MLKKKSKYNIAIVGARGAVGSEFRKILEERKFPVGKLRIFGSAKSKGLWLPFNGSNVPIEELPQSPEGFEGIDIILSSAGKAVSKQFAPLALKADAVIVDNTSAFRMDRATPLVVPEINGEDIKKPEGIIANPNCSAIIMLMAVAPLHRAARARRIIVSTYQSVSGAGANAMRELFKQTKEFIEETQKMAGYDQDELKALDILLGRTQKGQFSLKKEIFPHQIAFNLFSHNTAVSTNGYNEEENKIIEESRKILHEPDIQICPTCIRVPIFRAHAESIVVEFEKKLCADNAREILKKAPGIEVVDERAANKFPMPIESSGKDNVLVGRIREDLSHKNSLALFVAGDQLRKGAALNAVQIAEYLIK